MGQAHPIQNSIAGGTVLPGGFLVIRTGFTRVNVAGDHYRTHGEIEVIHTGEPCELERENEFLRQRCRELENLLRDHSRKCRQTRQNTHPNPIPSPKTAVPGFHSPAATRKVSTTVDKVAIPTQKPL
jgi:hypothetical protein